jgi:hypothetical protein
LFALLLLLGFVPGPLLTSIEDGTGQTLAEVGVSDPPPVFAGQGAGQ